MELVALVGFGRGDGCAPERRRWVVLRTVVLLCATAPTAAGQLDSDLAVRPDLYEELVWRVEDELAMLADLDLAGHAAAEHVAARWALFNNCEPMRFSVLFNEGENE